jgi:fermentation-respiration switch protein FrsA (DUF1100 family)
VKARLVRLGWLTAAIGAILIVVFVGLLWAIQRRLVFPRHMVQPERGAGDGIEGLERLRLGEVEAWFLPGDGSGAQRPAPAVIFAHGNAELIDPYARELEPYRRMGVSVLLPEFRGYGRSGGEPSQEGITGDFVRFYDLLAARPDVDRSRIVFHGRSLGGGVVCALAAERPPAALILLSTFTSVADMAYASFFVPRFLVKDPFDNLAVLEKLDRPVLIVHGRRDDVVPYAHAERLARVAPRATRVSYDCAHNDCPPDARAYWDDVRSFLVGAKIVAQP